MTAIVLVMAAILTVAVGVVAYVALVPSPRIDRAGSGGRALGRSG